jgi:hypothetical protein
MALFLTNLEPGFPGERALPHQMNLIIKSAFWKERQALLLQMEAHTAHLMVVARHGHIPRAHGQEKTCKVVRPNGIMIIHT